MKEGSTLVLDEIHKASKWKKNLKGVYDTLETNIRIIVTGSARLDLYKKGSDSLMGRYLGFRLHPFSIGEMLSDRIPSPDEVMKILEHGPDLSKKNSKHMERFVCLWWFPRTFTKFVPKNSQYLAKGKN